MDKKEINVLYEMIEQIPDHLVFNFGPEEWASVKVVNGESKVRSIMRIKEICILDSELTPLTEVEIHYHDEKEIFIVYEGTITVTIKDVIHKYSAGEVVEISPNTPHFVKTDDGCKLIAITIPANKYWSDVKD